ncbi:MAG: hypothetical protein G3M70_00015 [Candidatus Nitronauta litoralis]|uniref:Uncharacterized protein n=1 Tax=Candidatus Nitronauta litoralis TaxID=2705533 RepID=A0A7T0BSU5_9BACT|nr:MAG: hypothetical protein G3M70_00015 [Candidatus Nitronauta litoralis]
MVDSTQLIAALNRKDSLIFTPNLVEAQELASLIPNLKTLEKDGAGFWFNGDFPTSETIRIKQYPNGHLVFYTDAGQRFLMTDPDGVPLHEAEWVSLGGEPAKLSQVRMQLDSREWVGIKPKAKRFTTHIDIKSQPGWKHMKLDDLRKGAAQAWQVPFSEVKFFYGDHNFVSTGEGEYDVFLDKDSLYVLTDQTFEKKMFISHMFSVNWERLDLIPVVELFQSTLPGAGGAVFEFIWGLFEDQSRENPLEPLRYRGLPTYPSKEAFNIFNAFFIPGGIPEDKMLDTFLNPNTSNEIEWTPRENPPWRYFDEEQKLTVTVQDRFLYKASAWNDPTGLPFINISRGGFGPCGRTLHPEGDKLLLKDGADIRECSLKTKWNADAEAPTTKPKAPAFGWRQLFEEGVPEVDPVKLLYTVPFYPEGEGDIEESATQPLAVDQMLQYMEETEDMQDRLGRVKSVLIHTLDTVISGCVDCTQKRNYTVLFGDPEFAVKNAQLLWGHAASMELLDNLADVKFLSEAKHVESAYQQRYDMAFKWIPFMYHTDRETSEMILQSLRDVVNPGGILFLIGPVQLGGLFEHYRLKVLRSDPVEHMPYFRQHLKMCPENTINPYMTVFFAERMGD